MDVRQRFGLPFKTALHRLRFMVAILGGVLITPGLANAIDYTWTKNLAGVWTDTANWSGGSVFVSDPGNALIFNPGLYGNSTSINITSVPATLSMNTLTLGGSANTSGNSTVNIASSSSTWTIGDGTTSVVNLDGNYNGIRSLTYNIGANIALNQATTTFTGNGTGIFNFTGVFSGAGRGITKSGSSTLSVTNAANTYDGVTNITGGVLDATTFANVNTNSSIGKGSVGGSAADLVINGGTLRHSAANVASTDRLFSIGTSGGTIDSSAVLAANTLSFAGTGAMGFNSELGTRTLTLGGSNVGNNTMAVAIGDDGSNNATSLSKTGAGLWILSGTNTYTGNTTATGGALVATNTGALSGYNTSGKVVFNGGAIGGQVGGSGWTTGQIDTLLSNATKTSGQLAIDTTNGNVTQWANLSTANLGGLGIAKVGSNNLTLNQGGNYGGLNLFKGNVALDSITVTTPSLTFSTGAGNQAAITGGTLSMSGGTISRTGGRNLLYDTITSSITGSPSISLLGGDTNSDLLGGLQFAPAGNATQALGTITSNMGITDKVSIYLGGASMGNTLTAITFINGARWGVVRKRGPGEWTAGAVDYGTFQTYAGTFIAQGLLTNSAVSNGGTQVYGGTLILDYTNANTDRLGGGQPLVLSGGTLQLDRSTGATGTYIEVVTSSTLGGGWVNVTRGSGSSAKLRMNAITRNSGATIDFGAAGIADTDTVNTNGLLGNGRGWATVAGTDFATSAAIGTDIPINAYSGYTDVDRLTPGTIADGSTTNVRLVEGSGSAGNINLGAATTTINTLNQSASGGTGAATIDTAGKTLAVNAILAGAGSGGLTIGTSADSGTLQAGTAGGELIVHNYSSNPMTINSVIANNTSASVLIHTGTGTTILAGTNTYTGATRISGGVLEAALGTGLSSSTYLMVDGGVLQSSGSFTRTNSTTAGGTNFQWSSENGGGFSAKGGKLTVTVGNNAATTQNWAAPRTSTPGLNTANNAILGPLKFGSSTADSEVEFRNPINLNGEMREIQVTDNTSSSGDFATLSGNISNSSTASPAGIYKSGNGTLVLTGTNTYDGVTTVAGGTIRAGNGQALSTGPLALNSGGLDLNGNAVSIGMLSGSAGTTISSNVGGAAKLLTSFVGDSTFGGVISNGSGSVGFEKAGAGRLTFTAAQTYTGNTIISGGTLALANGASIAQSAYIQAGTAASPGGVLDVTALGSGLQVAGGQKLGGYGTVLGDVTIAGGAIVAPGGSIGTLTQSGTQTWGPGGHYLFEITNANGDGSYAGSRWDLLQVSSLMITATSGGGNQFIIDIQTLTSGTDDVAGAMSGGNWDPNTSYQWKFLEADLTTFTATNFDPSWFTFNTSSSIFKNDINGSFTVAYGGSGAGGLGGSTASNELYVVYAAVPEPSTLVLAGIGLVALGWRVRRRR